MDDLARLGRLLRLDRLFPKEPEAATRPRAPVMSAGTPQFGKSRKVEIEREDDNLSRRRTISILSLTTLGVLLGGYYFFYVLLNFKNAIVANATEVPGPYPNAAVIYLVIPVLFGVFYVLMDYLQINTGINPYRSPRGIAIAIATVILLWAVSGVPGDVIKHVTNRFTAQHGFAMCSSPFDPQHLHVYALQTYTAAYGCPTVPPPQQQ